MNDEISNGVLINSFGSDASGKQELDPTIFNNSKIIVDSLEQCKIGGDIHKSILNGTLKDEDIYGEFGEIVNGWKQGRENDDEKIHTVVELKKHKITHNIIRFYFAEWAGRRPKKDMF